MKLAIRRSTILSSKTKETMAEGLVGAAKH